MRVEFAAVAADPRTPRPRPPGGRDRRRAVRLRQPGAPREGRCRRRIAPRQPQVRAPLPRDGGAGAGRWRGACRAVAGGAGSLLGPRQGRRETHPRRTVIPGRAARRSASAGASHGRFASFREFYPFYLGEHRQPHLPAPAFHRQLRRACAGGRRRADTRNAWWLLAALVCGYGFAWVGHFFFEKNRPATFKHPLYSFVGDWVMFKDILTGRIRF